MPVQTISLFDTVTDSADAPVANATVTLTFGYNSATTADGLLQPSIKTVQTDGTGKFTFAKVIPNDLISPANTVYMIETPFRVYEVAPQSGNGASQQSTAANVIVNNPLALAPYTLIGPVSVTGTLAVTGALTVVSNTGMQVDALGNISGRSLSLSSTGPYTPGAGVRAGQVASAVRPFNVLANGVKGDLRRVMDGVMTSGTAILTSATAAFVAADVGKLCYVHNAGNAGGTIPLVTTIASLNSATSANLAANALHNVSAEEVMVSTDDGAAINNTILLASSAVTLGSVVQMPAGEYGSSVTINGKTAVSVQGEGSGITGVLYDLMQTGGYGLNFPSTVGGTPQTTRICYLGAANGTVYLESGIRNAGLYDIDLDGTYTAGVGLDLASTIQCTHRNVTVERASNTPGTGIRLRVLADAANNNCVYNRFEDCSTWWHNYGMTYSGGVTGASRCAVNSCTRTSHVTIGATGACIDFIQYCDTNWHYATSLKMLTASATAYAIIVNDSATPTAAVGCDGNYFNGLAFDGPSFSAPNIGVLLNASLQNFFEMGQCIIKIGNERSVPTPTLTTYTWLYHNSDPNLITSFPGPIEANGTATQGTPGFRLRYAGTQDIAFQREGAAAYVMRALTPNNKAFTIDQTSGSIKLGESGLNTITLDTFVQVSKDLRRSRQTPTETVLVSGVDAQGGELVGVTLTAARAVGAPLNPVTGQRLVFTLIQGGAGAFAVTWNAAFKGITGGTSGATGTRATFSYNYDGTNWNLDGAQPTWVA